MGLYNKEGISNSLPKKMYSIKTVDVTGYIWRKTKLVSSLPLPDESKLKHLKKRIKNMYE